MDIPGVGTNFLIILNRQGYNDDMTVKVEVDKKYFSGEMKQMETLRKKIVEELKGEILITPKIDLVEPDSIPKGDRQPQRLR